MIAIDSSALIATFIGEPEASDFLSFLVGVPCLIGAPTLLETHFVLRGLRQADATEAVHIWLAESGATIVPFDTKLLRIARDAFDHYGKGRGHKAGLNFGDCMSYAVAKAHDVPLLFKGNDFTQTDIQPAFV